MVSEKEYVSREAFRKFRNKVNTWMRAHDRLHKQQTKPLNPYGIGPYGAPGDWGGTMSDWVTRSLKHGAGIMRVIPLSSAWEDGRVSPFALDVVTGKYDLPALSPFWSDSFVAGLKLAQVAGMKVLVDIFDEVGLKAPDRQARHYFNGLNNIDPDAPVPGVPFVDTTSWKPEDRWRAADFPNQIEHSIANLWPGLKPLGFNVTLRRYVYNLVNLCAEFDDTVIFCPGNELPSRAVERQVFHWLDEAKWQGERCLNGAYLWNGIETAKEWLDDPVKRELFAQTDYLRFHHSALGTITDLLFAARAAFEAYPKMKAILDSDGVGSGLIRGEGGRPTESQEAGAAISGLNWKDFAYWISKILTPGDGLVILSALEAAWR